MAEGSNGAEIDSEMLKRCVAEMAIGCLGKGFDVSMDCRMEFCKEGGPLIVIDADMPCRTATIPGGFSIEGVPECVEIHEGQHLRDISGVLSFDEGTQLAIQRRRVTFSRSLRTVAHSIRGLVVSNCIRRGGINTGQGYNEWLATVQEAPVAISMSFSPITSWLSDVAGCEHLSRAIDLYLRDTPARDELRNFLEWQLPITCCPLSGVDDQSHPCLQFILWGPKLYIDTRPVHSDRNPVTGLRLCLEGSGRNILAINLDHFSSYPGTFRISDEVLYETAIQRDRNCFKPVKWNAYSHIYSEPLEFSGTGASDAAACIVTRTRFHVEEVHGRKVLYLVLGFTKLDNAKILRSEWCGTPFSPLNSLPADGSFPIRAPKMAKVVNTASPVAPHRHWVVTGAQLCVIRSKISLRVKFSLLDLSNDNKG